VPEDQRGESVDAARPAFARAFPRDPQLDALVEAFEAGDFAQVREEVPRLLAACSDERVKRAAELLLARTKPDPVAAILVGMTAVLLVILSAWWIVQRGAH
jgi:hypothetical protein